MQHKLEVFFNNYLLCIGITVYAVSTTLLFVVDNKSLFTWVGMVLSGILSVISGYIIESRKQIILFDTQEKALPTMVFGISCILIPVIMLILN